MIGVIFQDLQQTQFNNILPMESTAMFKLCAIQTQKCTESPVFHKKITALETSKLHLILSYSSALCVEKAAFNLKCFPFSLRSKGLSSSEVELYS